MKKLTGALGFSGDVEEEEEEEEDLHDWKEFRTGRPLPWHFDTENLT